MSGLAAISSLSPLAPASGLSVVSGDAKFREGFLRAAAANGVGEDAARARLDAFDGKRAELREVARQFESFFASLLLKEMKKTVHRDPTFHGGHAEDVFEDMLTSEQADRMTRKGKGLGIAAMVEGALSKSMGATLPNASTGTPWAVPPAADSSVANVRESIKAARRKLAFLGK